MGHDWVFEVLRDLATYARRNGMPGLAEKAEETAAQARAEIAARAGPPAAAETGLPRR